MQNKSKRKYRVIGYIALYNDVVNICIIEWRHAYLRITYKYNIKCKNCHPPLIFDLGNKIESCNSF